MAIDIHSHILPGIDDGAKNMQETIDMLDIAVKEGVRAIVATPHYEPGMDSEDSKKYQEVFEEVLQYIEQNEIPIQLFQGNEIYYTSSAPELLKEGIIRTINKSRYVLVEFSPEAEYTFIERAFSRLLYAGYWPILAHTERYASLRKIERVKELIRMGALIQVNTNAISGKEGWHAKWYCHQLLKNHLVHVIGTDAHSSRHRRPQMKECLAQIDKKYGRVYRRLISKNNPEKILNGEKIY